MGIWFSFMVEINCNHRHRTGTGSHYGDLTDRPIDKRDRCQQSASPYFGSVGNDASNEAGDEYEHRSNTSD